MVCIAATSEVAVKNLANQSLPRLKLAPSGSAELSGTVRGEANNEEDRKQATDSP